MEQDKVDSAATSEDQELAEAQRMLARAQQRKADAMEAARLAAQAALAKNLADEQERLVKAQKEAEEIQRKWAEKRALEEDAKRKEEAAKLAETRRLEAECEAREQTAREEAARQARVRKVQEAAHQAELDAQSIEASLRQANTPREEVKPVTITSAEHPLAFLFAPDAVKTAQPQSLSSEEHARQLKDSEKAVAMEPARKVHPCVDMATSHELEALLRPLLGQVNTTACDRLSSVWSCDALLSAARQVADQYRVKPMGHDAVLSSIEQLLESQQ